MYPTVTLKISSIIQLNKASSRSESSAFLPAPTNCCLLDLPLVLLFLLTPFSNGLWVYTSIVFRFFIDSLELQHNVHLVRSLDGSRLFTCVSRRAA